MKRFHRPKQNVSGINWESITRRNTAVGSTEVNMFCSMTNRTVNKRNKVEVLTANYPVKAPDKASKKAD
jgi:hypothetical protein